MDKQYNPDGFIPKYGGYEHLITYQKAEIIFDGQSILPRNIFTHTTALLIKWCRQHVPGNKIS